MGRPASGVIGIKMDKGDYVVGMDLVREGSQLLIVTANGMGKRTELDEYTRKGRAGQGVMTIKLKPNDTIAAARVVTADHQVTVITRNGIVMRTRASGISCYSRITQGVNIVNLGPKDRVAALSVEEMVANDSTDDTDANDSPGGVTLTA